MPPWKQNRVIYTKQELSWDKPLCRGREVQERGVKKFTGVLRIPAISSNFWLFMFFYPSLSLAVTLVSHGGPGFKLVAVLLLTFGSRSELLHILTDLSGVASSCKLIGPPPPHALAGIYWLRLFCVNMLLALGLSCQWLFIFRRWPSHRSSSVPVSGQPCLPAAVAAMGILPAEHCRQRVAFSAASNSPSPSLPCVFPR